MTNTYCSTIDITGADSDAITTATSLVLGAVQKLAKRDGIILSQDEVVGRTTLGTHEKEGKTRLQAILSTG